MKNNRALIVAAILLIVFIGGYAIINSSTTKGVKPRIENSNGFEANFFAKATLENKTAIILIGGGQWGDYWAQKFANHDFVGLSLPYTRREGLPKLPEEINLEYFETALEWLKKQPEVNPDKIILMGASRNAELSLVIASYYPKLVSGVIAYAPSSVSLSNTVLPYNSDELKASWRYKGADVPFVSMEKFLGGESNRIETLEYWKSGLAKSDDVDKAAIKAENINGPILLFSGKDDLVWPSTLMADMIEKRIKESDYNYSFQNIKYERAGHLISSNPDSKSDIRTGTINIMGKDYEFDFGGTAEGDFAAKQDAQVKVMEFIESI